VTDTITIPFDKQAFWEALRAQLGLDAIAYWGRAYHSSETTANIFEEEPDNADPSARTFVATLTPDTALVGFTRMLQPDYHLSPDYTYYALQVATGDFGALDSSLADAIVQTAVFGEIRYS
jgi:hypothetical protein